MNDCNDGSQYITNSVGVNGYLRGKPTTFDARQKRCLASQDFWCFSLLLEVYYSLLQPPRKPDLRIRGPEQLVNTKRALGPSLKWSVLICVLTLTSPAIFAQDVTDSTNGKIEILKLHWEKQVRLPRNFDPSVISSGVTFNDPTARTSASGPATASDATRAATSAQNAAAGANTAFPAAPNRLPVFYVYSLKIRNTGAKTIKAVAWDYVFIDNSSLTEVGRHQFLSYEKVAAGRSVTFKSQLRSPPARVVQASNVRPSKSGFAERAVVQCVLYADDSTWHNPRGTSDICGLLAKAGPVKRKGPSRQN